MRESFPAELLSREFRDQSSTLTNQYRASWQRSAEVVEPNAYFDSRFYALHNSDWAASATPFDHYLSAGLSEGRDPSAYVDFEQLRRSRNAKTNHGLYARLIEVGAGPSDGVYSSVAVLEQVQQSVLAQIRPVLLRGLKTAKRPNLVFVQNSGSPRIAEWAADPARSFDILANHYDTSDLATSAEADVRLFQIGTKSTAIAKLAECHRELFDGYNFVMLLDDDIALSGRAIERAFAECGSLEASLAQPGLSPDSECAWPDLFQDVGGSGALRTNTVEVMMPIFSGDFFARVIDTFQLSVSGFGLDLLWGSRLQPGESAWRLGTVTGRHENPVDRAGGAYYEFLRANHVNPRAELWSLISTHGLRRSIRRWPPA